MALCILPISKKLTMKDVFITSAGAYLPKSPISNDEMEDYLGKINGEKSRAKSRVLKQNGITNRHYAIDKNQQSTHSNAEIPIAFISYLIFMHLTAG